MGSAAGCDGGTVVISDGSAPPPARFAPPPAAGERAVAARPAPADRRDPPRRRTFDPPADPAPADADDAGAGDADAVASGASGVSGGLKSGRSRLGGTAAEVSDVAGALAILRESDDLFARRDSLKFLTAADPTPADRETVNATLNRSLMTALESAGGAAGDHFGAMMHWAEGPEAFRKIGEAAALASGPWAAREVVRRAALADDPDAANALTALLRDGGAEREALAAVERMGPRAEPAVLPLLEDADPAIRRDAAEILGRIGGEDAAGALLRRMETERDKSVAGDLRTARGDVLRRLRNAR